jgi:phosphate transport system substrate-binding protein
MRDESSGTREVFWEVLLGKGPISPGANVASSNGAVKVAVGKDPLAIGYTSLGHVDDTVKTVAIDGVAPTAENAVSGKYRVTRKLYMNTKGQPGELVQTFIDYIRGPEGAAIVREAGFIPVKE